MLPMNQQATSRYFLVPFDPPHLFFDNEEGYSKYLFDQLREMMGILNTLGPLELRLDYETLLEIIGPRFNETQQYLFKTFYPYMRAMVAFERGWFLDHFTFNGIKANDIFFQAHYVRVTSRTA